MFVAWFMTISLFLICIYSTYVIINGLKEKDAYDIVQLQSQFKNIAKTDHKILKQVV